jgi:hypothetical protein
MTLEETLDVASNNEMARHPDVIDIHDTQTIAAMTDRELLETIVAYLGSLDNRMDTIETVHKTVAEVVEGMASNPMLSMFLPRS